MADINHVISLGIGSPAAIPEFLTFGLQIAEEVVVVGGLLATVSTSPFFEGAVDLSPLYTGSVEVDPHEL